MIWSVQNHFGPIEGQGINVLGMLILNYIKNNQYSTFVITKLDVKDINIWLAKGQKISKANQLALISSKKL